MIEQEKIKFVRELFNPKVNKVTQLLKAKNQSNFDFAFALLKESVKHPVVKKWIYGVPFPKTFSELHNRTFMPSSNYLEGELVCHVLPIISEIDTINSFLVLKREFENSLLTAEYTQAANKLEAIKTKFGVSLWYIQNKLLLAELEGGTEKNWVQLSEFSKEISDGFLLFFIQNFSKKIESKNTYSRFNDILLNALNDIDLNDSFKEYLLYKLNFLSAKEYYY